MIVSGLRQIAPKTAHDHETASLRAQPGRGHGCAAPVQPRRRSTVATSAAVWHLRSPRSAKPNLSVTIPPTRLALSRRLSRHCSSAGWAAVPSSSEHTPELLVEVVKVFVPGALPDPHLATSGGQPVRAFHPVNVAVL